MRFLLWMGVLSVCLLGSTVDTILLPQYERWRKTMEMQKTSHRTEKPDRADRADRAEKAKIRPHSSSRSRNFVPNGNKCCKVGEKAAKKRLSCSSVGIYAAARNFNNYVHKAKISVLPKSVKRYAKVLTSKISKCSVKFSKRFEKCCRTRAEYFRQMKKCKRQKRPKRCRVMVKRRYRP